MERAVHTMEECAEIDRALGTEIRKTIFLRNRKKTALFLVILPADKHLDSGMIEKRLGVSRLSFASAELLEERLHARLGAASIMGLVHDPDEDIQLILDREVAESEWFGCNTGTNTTHLKLRTQDLIKKLIPKLKHRVEIMDLNDIQEVDDLASELFAFIADEIDSYESELGKMTSGILPVSGNTPFGMEVGALPSGRHAFLPLADGVSPNQGTDIEGMGAVAKSVSSIPHSRFTQGTLLTRNADRCSGCFSCVEVCPTQAIQVYGRVMTVAQVMREIRKDQVYFFHSGGGVTLSGGDILPQASFARELLMACQDEAINTSAEMDFYGSYQNIQTLLPFLNTIYIDIKMMDPNRHKKWTGVDNTAILNNITRAAQECGPDAIRIRVPLIEGINNDRENIQKTADFCRALSSCASLEFLPYHRLGTATYQYLNRPYPLKDIEPMRMETAQRAVSVLMDEDWPFDLKISGHILKPAKRSGSIQTDWKPW